MSVQMRTAKQPDQHSVLRNDLLAALTLQDLKDVLPELKLVPMSLGKVLYESGERQSHAYFPIDCIVSLDYLLEDSSTAEISVVGKEGLIGIALLLGGESTPHRAVVKSEGYAYSLPGSVLKDFFQRRSKVQLLLLRYSQALIAQMAQTVACNRHHSVDQQVCRSLLLSLDRLEGNQLTMTQELIATTLGVRRVGVSQAAAKLRKQGVIDYSRGKIAVLDRHHLEVLCCECYSAVRKETKRLSAHN